MSPFLYNKLIGLLITVVAVLLLWFPQRTARRWFKNWTQAHSVVFWTAKLIALVLLTIGFIILVVPQS